MTRGRASSEVPRTGLVLGVGARRGADLAELRSTVADCLSAAGARDRDVVAILTLDAKQHEPALRELAESLGVPLQGLPAAELARQVVANPSTTTQRLVGTGSVAEAAVLAVGGELILPKHSRGGVSVAVGRLPQPTLLDAPELTQASS